MQKSSALYRRIDDLFESPVVFNAYQTLVDGGKGRQIKRFLNEVEYSSVVDIGCGTGNWASLSEAEYLGIDTSASFIAGCRKRFAGDSKKEFVCADAASLGFGRHFDLAMLISVLHHLSDEQVDSLIGWLSQTARYFFVLDLYPIPDNPISRFLYRMDRGNFIRTPAQQRDLLQSSSHFKVLKDGDYYCPNRLYRHTLFLLEKT